MWFFGLSFSIVSKSLMKGEESQEKRIQRSLDKSGCIGPYFAHLYLFNTSKTGLKAAHIL